MRPNRTILPYEAEHIAMLATQQAQVGEAEHFGMGPGDMADLGPAFTAAELDEQGRVARVLCCAGLAEHQPTSGPAGGYATAWASFAEGLRGAEWSFVTAAIRSVINGCGYARIDMAVRPGFAAAHRYAEALGFEIDCMIYARKTAPNGSEA